MTHQLIRSAALMPAERRPLLMACVLLFIALTGTANLPALSQAQSIATEFSERQNVSDRLATHDVGLMGDGIDLNTGQVSFSHVDISLPGNSDLEVAIRRTRSQSFPYPHLNSAGTSDPAGQTMSNDFSDWHIETPRISIVLPTSGSGINRNLCNFTRYGGHFFRFPGIPPSFNDPFYNDYSVSNGMDLSIPGQGSQKLLYTPQGISWPSGTTKVTKDFWKFSCTPADRGATGMIATAPDGTTYKFDKFVLRKASPLVVRQEPQPGDPPGYIRVGNLIRAENVLLASEVTDVHGNWVRYTYNSFGWVTQIEANDGRLITINRDTAGLVQTIVANGQTWTYTYVTGIGAPALNRVTLPDTRYWEFSLNAFGFGDTEDRYDCVPGPYTVSLKHPDGMTGQYTFRQARHKHGDTSQYWGDNFSCLGGPPRYLEWYKHYSLETRVLSGTGYPTATWSYAYAGGWAATNSWSVAIPAVKWGEVTDPLGIRTRHTYHPNGTNEGLLQKEEIFDGATLLQTTAHEYLIQGLVGVTFLDNSNLNRFNRPRPLSKTTITRNGTAYTTDYAYNSTMTAADYSFARPTQVTKSSPLQTGSRIDATEYQHDLVKWILALPKKVTRNSVVFDEYVYNTFGKPTEFKQFGVTLGTFTWNTDGTLATSRDALNRETVLSSWKRGIPQSVTRPDSVTLTRVVDDNGRLTSQTDGKGQTTTYGYNGVGRLTSITRPGGFAATSISYTGLGAGTVQTLTTGAQRIKISYDSMLRPYLTETTALSGGGGTIWQRRGFDALNQETFTSFPAAASTAAQGVETSYDKLGRVIEVQENVTPFATTTTEYLTTNRIRTTDPEGNVTVAWRSGYGAPEDGQTVKIDQPLGVSTTMAYNIYGNLISAVQADSAVSLTQTWWYDARQRVCAQRAPETGTKRFEYNNANELTGYAEGITATGCAALPTDKTVLGYDLLGRNTSVDYPGTAPDITKGYDNNSNLASVSRSGVNWTYQNNALDALSQEQLQLDGRTYQFDYGYTPEGWLSTATVPFAGTVSFSPDGHGRAQGLAMGATTLASGGTYFPNGDLSALTLGNGQAWSATQNVRQMIDTAQAVAGPVTAFNRTYAYNAGGQLTAITDAAVAGENRALTYDDLGRLETASGPWGSGSFTYDGVGNLRQQVLGTRTIDVNYDTSNRVSQFRDTGAGGAWQTVSHDARGNVTALGALGFTYDASNQPTSVSGSAAVSYVYDGNLKRVKSTEGGQVTYSVYSSLTGKISVIDDPAGDRITLLNLGPVSVRVPASGAPVYTHLDHLGSPVAATNASGGVLWRESYNPYGGKRIDPAANQDKPGFTGHIDDDATGLTYMQARYYSPVIGRFLADDPVRFTPQRPDTFNRYAYAANDPVNANDPLGLAKCHRALSSAECEAAQEAADQARESAREAATLLQSAARTKPADRTAQQQAIVDAAKTRFGNRAGSAPNLRKIATALTDIANDIGARGQGITLRAGTGGDMTAYVTAGDAKNIFLNSRFFSAPGALQARIIAHEQAHISVPALWDYYADDLPRHPGFVHLHIAVAANNNQRKDMYDLYGNADSYACVIPQFHSGVCGK